MKALALFAATSAVALSACGYTPMYAPVDGGDPARAQITLGTITSSNPAIQSGERRTAQEVARELHTYFPSENPNLDILNVSVLETQTNLAVQRNATVARAEIALEGKVTILGKDGESKLHASVVSRAAYNVEENPFSTESGRRYARLTAAKNLAEEISRRVVLFYRQPAEINAENKGESAE